MGALFLGLYYVLLSRALLEALALQYCLSFPNLLLHKSPNLERQTEEGDEALGILMVVKLSCGEGYDVNTSPVGCLNIRVLTPSAPP